MDPHDGSAVGDGEGDGGRRPLQSLIHGQVEHPPDEALPRCTHQDGPFEYEELAQAAQDLQVMPHRLAEADSRIDDDPLSGNPPRPPPGAGGAGKR